MDHLKQKLKNRLNLKFDPNKNHPSHRYSLKKISLEKSYKDVSQNEQEIQSQSILLSSSRNKSLSAVRLPSLQKVSNNLINKQSPSLKKGQRNIDSSLLNVKQKLRVSSIKLNKIQGIESMMDQSITSQAVGNLSKFNYGIEPVLFRKDLGQKIFKQENSMIQRKRQTEKVIFKHKRFEENEQKSVNASIISSAVTQRPHFIEDSIKNIPQRKQIKQKVKVESKSSIHQTLTFLIKNQILTVPKIVALLKKSHSQEFLYMKVRGIYEFQVCDENDKGKDFITVSRNGMVIDGEIISLQKMVHQFQMFQKLRKIPFFKNFIWSKFMTIWGKGSKKAQFIQNRWNLNKLLNLQDKRLFKKISELKNTLFLDEQSAGSVKQDWVDEIIDSIRGKRKRVVSELIKICYQILSKYDLPLSQSNQMLTKVLDEFNGLNVGFQVRIRIEKEMETFYKASRCLQLQFFYRIGWFIMRHIEALTKKILHSSRQYQHTILKPMQMLDIQNDSYSLLKEQMLLNSPLTQEVQFTMKVDQHSGKLNIHPSAQNILHDAMTFLQIFYQKMEKQPLKLVRIDEFNFLDNILKKFHGSFRILSDQKPLSIKSYVSSFTQYHALFQKFEDQIIQMSKIIEKRQKLEEPYLQVFKEFKEKNGILYTQQCFYSSFQKDLKQVASKKQFCNKIHDGEYFILGYLDLSNMKTTILNEINKYEQKIFDYIPQMNQKQKTNLISEISDYLRKIQVPITSPELYIQIVELAQEIQLELPQFSSKILELQKIATLYYKNTKKQLLTLTYQKNLLNQLRSKIKSFKQKRESIYFQYRRLLETQKKNLIQKVQKISLKSEQLYSVSSSPWLIHKKIKENISFLIHMNSEIKHFNELQIFYGLKETRIPKLEVLLVEYESLQEIWNIYQQWQENFQGNSDKNVFTIEVEKQLHKFETYLRKLEKYVKNIEYFQLCKYLQTKVSQYVESMQFILEVQFKSLRGEDFSLMNKSLQNQLSSFSLKQSQLGSNQMWKTVDFNEDNKSTISEKINVKKLTLRKIVELQLYQFKNILEQITFKCRKQLQIKETIEGFLVWWKNLKLSFKSLDDYPLVYIFDTNDNIRRQIDQYSTILVNILNHKHGAFIRKQCTVYLKNMNDLTQLLRLTIQHQQKFLTLYPILTSSYAEKHLLPQFKRFETILQKTMRNLRWLIKPTQSLNEQTRSLLLNHIKHFDMILKYLADFLQKKRIKFQRFYFLQDTEMLQLLVGSSNQNHVFRMFDGIRGWYEDKQQIKIGVIGVGGQHLKLKGWVYKNNEPQTLFRSLEEAIKLNLNSIVRKILHSYESELKELKDLYKNIPWMCVYTVQLILFTKQIELNCFYEHISFEMQKSLIRQNISAASSSPIDNSNYITLMLFLLHFTQQLQKQNVTNVFHFQWFSFLKYYHQNNNVVMRCLGEDHSWGGEYQGLWNLMVNTSDIRRVHTSVLTNLKFSNGVLLQGPSGTGKTQSLKQLARCMAKYCVVFNCSGEVSIQTLEKLLSGLCYTASWICMDEINRLNPQIMSVIANQINIIKNALNSGKSNFNFMGKKIQLKHGVGIFSTMNPIYLQRATLTQNLKTYFRVISVSSPNYETILQVMLYGLKFLHAQENAKKISRLLKNLSIQLGKHLQYDFGMRTIKVFIKILQKIKKQHRKEQQAIYFAFYETFYCRLNPYDEATFDRVMKDVLGFSSQNIQFSKEKYLSILSSVQTGTIIVGPTSCKTTLISKFLNQIKEKKTKVQIFNPSCLEQIYLMGQNILGRWSPGVLERVAKRSIQNENQMNVLILDSKLKSEMIENFNTLLDESKLLTLPNGTRIKVRENFKLIMQTPDLSMTSPATITRCHLIYVDLKDVKKQQIIESILPNLEPQTKQRISLVLKVFQIDQILRIGQIYPIFWNIQIQMRNDQLGRKTIDKTSVMHLTQNQIKGLQKVIFYTIQLLDLTKKIKSLLSKQNIIPLRKSAHNFIVSFQKYPQGEFKQISWEQNFERTQNLYWIPTISSQFCKFVTKQSIKKKRALIWNGKNFTGKTLAIRRSVNQSIQSQYPNEKKLINIAIDKLMSSKQITQLIEDKISTKNFQVPDDVIIMVQNVNMCNQQSGQFFRYLLEYGFLFSNKIRNLIKFQNFSTIFQFTNSNGTKNYRLNRLFAEVPFPQLNENQITDLYSKLIRANIAETKTTSLFKENLSIEIQKISVFLNDYTKRKNKMIESLSQNHIYGRKPFKVSSQFQIIPCLNNLKIINEKFIKEPSDFVQFLLTQLRKNEIELNEGKQQNKIKILDLLKLSFNQSFKQKYQQAYTNSLKSIEGLSTEVSFYTGVLTGNIQRTDWTKFKTQIYKKMSQKFYVSEFMITELIYLIRTLQYQGGNYILVGKQGFGKKVLFKMAAELCDSKFISLDNIQKTRIKQAYFSILKQAFLKDKKIVLCIDAASKNYHEWLLFLERLRSGYPMKFLFKSEEIEEAYSITQGSPDYEGAHKSYDEVIRDFFLIGDQKIHIFISCRFQNASQTIQNYNCIVKRSVIRYAHEFPIDSIAQISEKILEDNISQKQNARRLSSVFLKLYQDLNFIIQENQKIKGFSYFKHNSISHFKLMQNYVQNQKDIVQHVIKNQDKLNRAVVKVQETYSIHQKLKSQIQHIKQKIQKSQQILTSFLPDLQKKKANFNHLNQDFHFDKKQISGKRKEIEDIEKQIEVKRKAMEPYLRQAADSLFSIKRADLNQIRAFTILHPLLRFSIENLMILLGEQETEENMKKVLGDHNILLRMKNCHTNVENCLKVRTRIQSNQEWTFESLSKVAFHFRYLQKWTVNTLKVNDMRNDLNDTIKLYQKLRQKLIEMETVAQEKYSLVISAETQLHQIEEKYVQNKNSLTLLQQKLTINTRKVNSVQNIKASLQSYKQSWIKEIIKSKGTLKNLQYITTVYTYFMKIHPYLKQQDKKEVKIKLQDHLKKAMFTVESHFEPFQFLKQKLLSESLINQQKSNQISHKNKYQSIFSNKNLSYQDINNINISFLKHYFHQRPIIFDPDNQALKWLHQKLQGSHASQKNQKMIITRSSFTASKKNVQLAIKEGYLLILIVEDEFDEFTSEILNSKITHSMNRRLIEYNKNLLYVDQNFEIILCNKSRKPNPSLTYFNEHQVINFQVTKEFLNIQLLNELLISESQTIYQLKKNLQIEKKMNVQEKYTIQTNIIELLTNLKKQVFDDEKLIQIIHQSNQKVEILEVNLKQLSEKMSNVYSQTYLFEDLCQKVSDIYFSLQIMSQMSQFFNWNIQILTKYFIDACVHSISQPLFSQTDEKEDNFSFGNHIQQALLNYQFDNYIGNGNSRATSALSYVSAVTSKIILEDRKNDFQEQIQVKHNSKQKKQVSFDEVIPVQEFFIDETKKGFINKERQTKIIERLLCNLKNTFDQKQKISWALILSLMQSPESQLKLLFNSVKQRDNIEDYIEGKQITKNMKEIFLKLKPNAKVFANQIVIHPNPFGKYSSQFSALQILLLCKLLKPSRFYELCLQLIQIKGYSSILQYKKVDVSDLLAGSDCIHPILLMMGEDPLPQITEYFARKNYKHVTLIAMGEGQSKIAQIVLEKEYRKQNIVIIHNLHISPEFYEFLSKTLQQFQYRRPHKNFRLILITSLRYPIDPYIAGSCHKFLISQPNDIKNQMKNIYEKISMQFTERNHHKIIFSICYFHAMLNQIRRYKNFGWNSPYQFNQSDFMNAIKIVNFTLQSPLSLKNYQCNIDREELKDQLQQEIDFQGLQYLIGQMSYVGKLVNEIDRQKMRIYVNTFITSQILKEEFKFFKNHYFPKKFAPEQIQKFITQISTNSMSTYGLLQSLKPQNQQIEQILNNLRQCFTLAKLEEYHQKSSVKLQLLDQINHNFDFINLEIENFNQHLNKFFSQQNKQRNYSSHQSVQKNYQFLKEINKLTKVFDLRAFSNPSQFFIEIQKQAAIRLQTQYEKIQLFWSIHPKQNIPCYGVKNLKLQGGSITRKQNYFYLDTGKGQEDILLYVFGVQKKKKIETHSNRKLVKIPLYLNHKRQGQINSYGDNTNLLTMVCLESAESQQSWILRSTAFTVENL